MNYCPNCGKPVAGDDRFCANCGTSMTIADPSEPTENQGIATPSENCHSQASNPITPPVDPPKKQMGCFSAGCIGILTWFAVLLIRGCNAASETGNAFQ